MADQMVLVNTETGDELTFTDRSEYLAVKYSGGWQDKPASQPVPRPVVPERPPMPRPERREPVNDNPTVEHSTVE